MENETEKIIKERLAELPNSIKRAIFKTDIGGAIQRISQRNRLHLDQASNLETEIMLVMLGLEPSDDFVKNLATNLSIDQNFASRLSGEINNEIFNVVKMNMMKEEEKEAGPSSLRPTTIEPKPAEISREEVLKEIENPPKIEVSPLSKILQEKIASQPIKSPSNLPAEKIVTPPTPKQEQKTDQEIPSNLPIKQPEQHLITKQEPVASVVPTTISTVSPKPIFSSTKPEPKEEVRVDYTKEIEETRQIISQLDKERGVAEKTIKDPNLLKNKLDEIDSKVKIQVDRQRNALERKTMATPFSQTSDIEANVITPSFVQKTDKKTENTFAQQTKTTIDPYREPLE